MANKAKLQPLALTVKASGCSFALFACDRRRAGLRASTTTDGGWRPPRSAATAAARPRYPHGRPS